MTIVLMSFLMLVTLVGVASVNAQDTTNVVESPAIFFGGSGHFTGGGNLFIGVGFLKNSFAIAYYGKTNFSTGPIFATSLGGLLINYGWGEKETETIAVLILPRLLKVGQWSIMAKVGLLTPLHPTIQQTAVVSGIIFRWR